MNARAHSRLTLLNIERLRRQRQRNANPGPSRGRRLTLAPAETIARLEEDADLVVCLLRPDWFPGIAAFYEDFHQLEDHEVVALMNAAQPAATAGRSA